MHKIKAYIFLALNFFLHWLRKIFFTHRGLHEFYKNYSQDRIFSVSVKQRQEFPLFESCILCGFCDMACPQRIKGSFLQGPSFFVNAFSRDLTSIHLIKDYPNVCQDCRLPHPCDKECPQKIPIASLIHWMNEANQTTMPA